MRQNGHMMTTMEEIDEHVSNARGGLTMEMGNKRTALFFPLYHQLIQLPSRILICAAYIRALSNTHCSSSFFSRRPSFTQKQHRPCRLVYQLVVSDLSLLFNHFSHLSSQDGGTFFFT